MQGARFFGPKTGCAGLVSFLLNGLHAHVVVTVTDQWGVALRGGYHCTQLPMRKLDVESTIGASFNLHNTKAEADRLIEVMGQTLPFFNG